VDVSGRWIIPGLIDGHVHLVDPQAGVLRWSLPRYLAWKSPRSGRPRPQARAGAADDLARGGSPGRGCTPRRDDRRHAAHLSRRARRSHRAEVRKAVDRLVSAGADFIKIYT
jgi:hypothetical protein